MRYGPLADARRKRKEQRGKADEPGNRQHEEAIGKRKQNQCADDAANDAEGVQDQHAPIEGRQLLAIGNRRQQVPRCDGNGIRGIGNNRRKTRGKHRREGDQRCAPC